MLNEKQKAIIIKSSILSGIVIFSFAVIITLMIFSRSFFENGLKNNIQTVLDKNFENTYIVQKQHKLKNAQGYRCAVFSCTSSKDNSSYSAIIMNIPGIMGVQSGVFLCKEGELPFFVDYVVENGKAGLTFNKELSSGTISYWENKINEILKLVDNSAE